MLFMGLFIGQTDEKVGSKEVIMLSTDELLSGGGIEGEVISREERPEEKLEEKQKEKHGENQGQKQEERIDPRVKRTRKLLLDSFLTLLAEKRYEDITIQDITTRATVNRATFYAHFVDKCALVDDCIRETFAEILCRRQITSIDSVYDYLLSLVLAVTDHWTKMDAECPQSYQAFKSLAEAQIKTQLRENVRTWLLAHTAPSAHNHQRLELAATIISWSVYGAGVHWAQSGDKQPVELFANDAFPLIAATITALNEQGTE
jgi:AcrR family transcriptional regulator